MDTMQVPQGTGSGFIWDMKGHVVTNFHVIRGASDIKVALIDSSVYPAKVCPHVTTSSQHDTGYLLKTTAVQKVGLLLMCMACFRCPCWWCVLYKDARWADVSDCLGSMLLLRLTWLWPTDSSI